MAEKLILVGAIEGAFGVRGEVRLRSFTSPPDNIAKYGPLRDADGRVILTPKSARPLKDAIAVTAPEIAQREEAEAMRGTRLYIARDILPPPEDEDEFYVVDLIGCAVQDVSGDLLGEVIAVHDFGAGDIVELKQPDGRTRQLGFTRDTFPKVDLSARKLVADPPPELEDGDEQNEGEQ